MKAKFAKVMFVMALFCFLGTGNVFAQHMGTGIAPYSLGDIWYDGDFNVGVGTSTPAAFFHVVGGEVRFGLSPNYASYSPVGTLTFNGSAYYNVLPNQWAFKGGAGSIGLRFHAMEDRLEFTNVAGDAMFFTNIAGTDQGSGYFAKDLYVDSTLTVFSGETGSVISDAAVWGDANGIIVGNAGLIMDDDNIALNLVGKVGMRFWVNELAGSSTEAMVIDNQARVGIGTNTPQTLLHLGGTGSAFLPNVLSSNGADFGVEAGENMTFGHYDTGADLWTESMRLDDDGNLGIGTTTPSTPLDIKSPGIFQDVLRIENSATNDELMVLNEGSTGNANLRLYDVAGNNTIQFNASSGGGSLDSYLNVDGNFGIGTDTPSEKLEVAGTIKTCEVVVEVLSGCDFVFEEDYDLMPIDELAQNIKENKHLPGIAPASVMEMEGIGVSEFQLQLLQKVEELTLYVIELNEKNSELEETISTLTREVQ